MLTEAKHLCNLLTAKIAYVSAPQMTGIYRPARLLLHQEPLNRVILLCIWISLPQGLQLL